MHPVAFMVEALCYKPERSQVRVQKKSLNIFNLPNTSSRIMVLGFIQPLTEMGTRSRKNISVEQSAAGA
jgi:hypothetical protein